MKDKNNFLPIRSFNKREKLLIIIFIFMIMVWSFNKYIFRVQAKKIETLEATKTNFDVEIDEINKILEGEEFTRSELSSLTSTIYKLGNSYFPNLDQSQLIYYLEHIFIANDLKIRNLYFGEREIQNLDDFDVQYMEISIPFEGKYEDIIKLVNNLKDGPFKIIIESLSLGKINNQLLEGELLLKVYCLEDILSLPLSNLNLKSKDYDESIENFNPFEEIEKEEEDLNIIYDNVATKSQVIKSNNESKDINKNKNKDGDSKNINQKELIHDFINSDYKFFPSHDLINGGVTFVNEDYDNYLRFEYKVKANDFKENRAYIDMSKQLIKFMYPESRLFIRLKSFNYSSAKLGITFRTYDNEIFDLTIAESIDWIGWKDIEFSISSNLSYYPLELTNIYYQAPNQTEDIGVLFLDKIELEKLDDYDSISNFYTVEENDTLTSIAIKIHGSDRFISEIVKDNNLVSEELIPGKVLIIRRR